MILKNAARAAAVSTAILAGMVTVPGQASADTTGPVVSQIGKVQTDTGLELTAHIDAPADVTSVTATLTAGTASVPKSTVTDFHLVSGTATSGTWQSSGSLGLDVYASYRVAITAQDSQGTVSLPGRGLLAYRPSLVFHDTAYEPTALSFEHQDINVTGRVTEYDPAAGDTGPWQAPAGMGVYVTWDGHTSPNNATAADGTFAFTVHPGAVQNTTLHVFATTTTTYGQGPDSEPITSVDSPIRITLDHTGNTGAPVGSTQVISGTAERQQEDGTWVPLANVTLPIQASTGGQAAGATTDATGRFSQTVPVTNGTTIWTVSYTRPFLTPASVSYTIAKPVAKVSLYANKPTVDAYSRLHISGYPTFPGNWLPYGRVYIQQSNDGHTGWTNIGSTTFGSAANGFATSVLTVTNPHGYWRYYYPGAPGFTAAYSPVVHAFRYQTAISGGKPSSTRVTKRHTVTISGTLKQNGYGSWAPLPKATVQIFYRPSGSSSTWHLRTSVRTSSTGYFVAHPTITSSGTWRVVYRAPDQVHVNAYGPMVKVTAI
ncbi:hypothetical protein [Streptomyces adustus]